MTSFLHSERHPVTEKTWAWLEGSEGSARPPDQRVRIRKTLEELDRLLYELDAQRPLSGVENT